MTGWVIMDKLKVKKYCKKFNPAIISSSCFNSDFSKREAQSVIHPWNTPNNPPPSLKYRLCLWTTARQCSNLLQLFIFSNLKLLFLLYLRDLTVHSWNCMLRNVYNHIFEKPKLIALLAGFCMEKVWIYVAKQVQYHFVDVRYLMTKSIDFFMKTIICGTNYSF